jgi:tRNA-2-methylthio-N6-dimethylallyladenosine synthase
MTQKLVEAVAQLDKVCEHISLPVQAGDNDILRRMRRGYTIEQYRSLVEQIRLAIPDVGLSTDVIVGFPGEDETQFERTASLLNDLRFDTVHIAAYSPRPGTIASREFEDDVPSQEKQRRRLKLEAMQKSIATGINAQLWCKEVEVLVEGSKNSKWQGRTRSGKLVFFSDNHNRLGQLVKVEIEKTSPWSLQGKVCGKMV